MLLRNERQGQPALFFRVRPARVPKIILVSMSHLLRQPPHDLFGEIAVTEDDLEAWVAAVSPVHLTERLYDNYVRRYDVANKVRWAKARGEFESITATRRPVYHARLALSQII
jgi:hypothetical protein